VFALGLPALQIFKAAAAGHKLVPALLLMQRVLVKMADLLLPNLLTGNCSDCVCVRVSRFWNFYDTNNETKLLHADMVLIDEEVYPPADELFKNRVKEDCVYTFSYFRVRASNIYYKPVENDQMLVFTK